MSNDRSGLTTMSAFWPADARELLIGLKLRSRLVVVEHHRPAIDLRGSSRRAPSRDQRQRRARGSVSCAREALSFLDADRSEQAERLRIDGDRGFLLHDAIHRLEERRVCRVNRVERSPGCVHEMCMRRTGRLRDGIDPQARLMRLTAGAGSPSTMKRRMSSQLPQVFDRKTYTQPAP